ncbi:uncharacterized protein LOC131885120 [Tigriopus californicus]|uniref:uncharacterized protein LOC131885120 n=1 Tax=Tigriopus californicus TaxID=6832 RepID=UPI0027DA9DEE|nr:uncharacterized protein LOC131885120 [Tigriopus californicus]
MTTGDDVELDQSDFSSNVRWAKSWQSIFFALYCFVMLISLILFLCLLRSVARNNKKEIPTYFFLIFIFFLSLVEDALIIHQFILVNVKTRHTTTLCQFFTYVVYGNKIVLALTVTSMVIYTWVHVEFKRSVIEQTMRKYFPVLIIGLFVVELLLAIEPTLNVRGSAAEQYCYHVDKRFSTRRRTGWLYLVLYPYFVPLVVCLFPCIKLGLKLRDKAVLSIFVPHVKVTLVTVIGYFFFHVLYYLLMLAREIEASVLDLNYWRQLLGLHIWYITRPMFALVAYGWYIVVPLGPFLFDPDFMGEFPGNFLNRQELVHKDEENRNSICMSDTVSTAETMRASSLDPDSMMSSPQTRVDVESAGHHNPGHGSSNGGRAFENPLQSSDGPDVSLSQQGSFVNPITQQGSPRNLAQSSSIGREFENPALNETSSSKEYHQSSFMI